MSTEKLGTETACKQALPMVNGAAYFKKEM